MDLPATLIRCVDPQAFPQSKSVTPSYIYMKLRRGAFVFYPSIESIFLESPLQMQLRLILAMAFNPQLLLLDGPLTALDLYGKRDLLRIILKFVKIDECSVVLRAYTLEDIELLSRSPLVLNQGKIV